MSIIIAAMLASSPTLPFIDRAALSTLAKFEAKQASSASRKASAAKPMRLIARLCLGADANADGDASGNPLGRAYSMAGPEVSILKNACARHRASLNQLQTASLSARGE